MMCDSVDRFQAAQPRRVAEAGTVSIVYTGTLAHNRWMSLVDLCQATAQLGAKGQRFRVTAFASLVPPEAVNILGALPELQIIPPVAHDAVPGVLKGADILFLPETFDDTIARDIHLSLSTKAHLYMFSERPIIVYGSPITGIVDYAKREGWAYVVDERKIDKLTEALRVVTSDDDLCRRLVRNGVDVAKRNHDERVVRQRFCAGIKKAVHDATGVDR